MRTCVCVPYKSSKWNVCSVLTTSLDHITTSTKPSQEKRDSETATPKSPESTEQMLTWLIVFVSFLPSFLFLFCILIKFCGKSSGVEKGLQQQQSHPLLPLHLLSFLRLLISSSSSVSVIDRRLISSLRLIPELNFRPDLPRSLRLLRRRMNRRLTLP